MLPALCPHAGRSFTAAASQPPVHSTQVLLAVLCLFCTTAQTLVPASQPPVHSSQVPLCHTGVPVLYAPTSRHVTLLSAVVAHSHSQTVRLGIRKKKKGKDTPFGVNLIRSQGLYRAAQELRGIKVVLARTIVPPLGISVCVQHGPVQTAVCLKDCCTIHCFCKTHSPVVIKPFSSASRPAPLSWQM